MKVLHLSVKSKWYKDIESGIKDEEYRLMNDYWKKRLESKDYDLIYIKLGYPAKDDFSRIMVFKYQGFNKKSIVHEEFGRQVLVYAINLGKRIQ